MNINASEVPKGMDYQYATVSVCGDRSFNQTDEMQSTGWRPVPASRHPSLAKRSVSGTWIEIGGLLLMERPKVLTAGAVAWENDKASAQRSAGHHVLVRRTFTLRECFTKVCWSVWFSCRTYLRRMLVRAAPTCTLWRYHDNEDAWRFVLRHAWAITDDEILDASYP